jgi:hypothetical protein
MAAAPIASVMARPPPGGHRHADAGERPGPGGEGDQREPGGHDQPVASQRGVDDGDPSHPGCLGSLARSLAPTLPVRLAGVGAARAIVLAARAVLNRFVGLRPATAPRFCYAL